MIHPAIPGKWTRQPQYPARIDLSHPFAQDILAFIYPTCGMNYDAVSGQSLVTGLGAVGPIDTPFGTAFKKTISGGTSTLTLPEAFALDSTPLSMFALCATQPSTVIKNALELSGAALRMVLGFDASEKAYALVDGATTDPLTTGTAVLTAGQYYALGMVWNNSGASTHPDLYVDGVLDNAATTDSTASSGTIGTINFGGGTDELEDGIIVGIVWKAAKDAEVMKSLRDNPWQMLVAPERRIWVPVTAGGGVVTTTVAGRVNVNGIDVSNKTASIGLNGADRIFGAVVSPKISALPILGSLGLFGAGIASKIAITTNQAQLLTSGLIDSEKVVAGVITTTIAGFLPTIAETSGSKISAPGILAYLNVTGTGTGQKTSSTLVDAWIGTFSAMAAAPLGGMTLTPADIAAIADAVWAHTDAVSAHSKLDDILVKVTC